MSVVIRGMEMPEDCWTCFCLQEFYRGDTVPTEYRCGATCKMIDLNDTGRLKDCPVFEIKKWEDV